MPLNTPSSPQLLRSFQHSLERLRSTLLALDIQAMARQSGFLRRRHRKIPMADLALALVAAGTESILSLDRVAHWIGLASQTSYSKQAFHKRLRPQIEPFLGQLAASLFGSFLLPLRTEGWLAPFPRVLLHDSTSQGLPDHLATLFVGARNGRSKAKAKATLKIQCVADLLQGSILQLSLSGFTRNDQAAAADILALVRPGDLILRDLGYFSLTVLARLQASAAFFLTRWRRDLSLRDARTGRELNLAHHLRQEGRFDRVVLVGEQRVAMRLVALAVPPEVANLRRHRSRTNRDRRLNPDQQSRFLMGWNIFLTNVKRSVWPASVLAKVYRLRWRVEIIFKAWKSHLGLRQLNCRTADLLRLSVLSKLLFCALLVGCCAQMEALCSSARQVSLLRMARLFGQFSLAIAATLLQTTPQACLQLSLRRYLFYDVRSDRNNFQQLLLRATTSS
jgi:hypothetical protein